MKKIGVFLVFLPAAIAAAALFGMLHDQISYSVSPEYYTKFKFIQFRLLDPHIPDRVRAAIVGFRASWWMGIPLGIFCGSAGSIQRSPTLMCRALIISILIVVVFTMASALFGLATVGLRRQQLTLQAIVTGSSRRVCRTFVASYARATCTMQPTLAVPRLSQFLGYST